MEYNHLIYEFYCCVIALKHVIELSERHVWCKYRVNTNFKQPTSSIVTYPIHALVLSIGPALLKKFKIN